MSDSFVVAFVVGHIITDDSLCSLIITPHISFIILFAKLLASVDNLKLLKLKQSQSGLKFKVKMSKPITELSNGMLKMR